jgi:hypothetical protein
MHKNLKYISSFTLVFFFDGGGEDRLESHFVAQKLLPQPPKLPGTVGTCHYTCWFHGHALSAVLMFILLLLLLFLLLLWD